MYYLLIEILGLQEEEEASSQIQLESSKSCAQGIAVFSHGDSPSTSWRRPQAIAVRVLDASDQQFQTEVSHAWPGAGIFVSVWLLPGGIITPSSIT